MVGIILEAALYIIHIWAEELQIAPITPTLGALCFSASPQPSPKGKEVVIQHENSARSEFSVFEQIIIRASAICGSLLRGRI